MSGQSKNIKEIIKKELIKCIGDPIYFLKSYGYISHKTRGKIRFNLFPFQEQTLKILRDNQHSVILKGRQMGISTLIAGIALHMILFQDEQTVLIVATKQKTAKNLLNKVKLMFDNLPSWLKKEVANNNELELKLSNGSEVKAASAASDDARSDAASLLIIDEAAFISENKVEEVWGAAAPTLATGGKSIVLSTPNGTGNFFHKRWKKAINKEIKCAAVKLPWHLHPERDQTYRDDQDAELGPKLAAQENDCDFLTSGDSFIHTETLQYYREKYVKNPIERRGVSSDYWIWEYMDPSKEYTIIADVARGDGSDYSTFHVFENKEFKQVAEFKSQIPTHQFSQLLISVGYEWNNAMLIIENASLGWSVVENVQRANYPNLYYSPKESKIDFISYIQKGYDLGDTSKMIPGFTMSVATRPLILGKLEETMRDRAMIIQSARTMDEFDVFIWNKGRAEAQTGYNDDLVMPCGIYAFLRDTVLRFDQQNRQLTKNIISNYRKTDTPKDIYVGHDHRKDQWSMRVGDRDEDLTWLL